MSQRSNKTVFKGLKPEALWHYFEEICRIPRLSKNEKKIREYLLEFAGKNKLEAKEDNVGNILITRPSHADYMNRKTVVLQSHMDMVGEKNSDHPHNWESDPIIPVLKGGWITASGTTLGADDGIGIAAQMALLTDIELKAGEIECLFTVDEESGMTGAKNLNEDFFKGRILLNLDSEDEGILYIGCAGGMDTVGTMNFKKESAPPDHKAIEISLTGLRGGHSGDEIHKGFGNSLKIMADILHELQREFGIFLNNFNGGNLKNAIPREAFAKIVCKKNLLEIVKDRIRSIEINIQKEFGAVEQNLKLKAVNCRLPQFIIDPVKQEDLISMLKCCPHGVLSWSKDMKGLVETSTNLASVKFKKGDIIEVVTTQRSSSEHAKRDASGMVESCMKQAGAIITKSTGYPGWTPDLNSEILKITCKAYKKLFGNEPGIKAIHAGLECGLIYEKFRKIDMISFGPTIKGAHTPTEMIEIRTVIMFWDLLKEVISNIPVRTGSEA